MPSTTCPACDKRLTIPDGVTGRSVRCPGCSHRFALPPKPVSAEPLDLPDEPAPIRPGRTGKPSRLPQRSGGRRGLVAAAVVAVVLVAGGAAVWMASGGKPEPIPKAERVADAGPPPATPPSATPASAPPPKRADAGPLPVFVMGPNGPVEQPPVKPKDQPPAPKSSPPKPADPVKPKEPPAKVDDRKWVADAKLEYRDALVEKERRMKATADRLGRLSESDFELAKEILKGIQMEGIEGFPNDFVSRAAVIAPDYIAALRRERVVNSEDYPRLVKSGAVPQYHPAEKRKELYAAFAEVTGLKPEWSVSVPFSGLTAKEMDTLMEGVPLLKAGGLGKLTTAQRRLLLKAGGLDYFGAQLAK